MASFSTDFVDGKITRWLEGRLDQGHREHRNQETMYLRHHDHPGMVLVIPYLLAKKFIQGHIADSMRWQRDDGVRDFDQPMIDVEELRQMIVFCQRFVADVERTWVTGRRKHPK